MAAVYDGRELRNYVDGPCAAQGLGQTSVGVRFNKVNYFKGAIRTARMTPRALEVKDFLPLPY